jgi:hypothetical protein
MSDETPEHVTHDLKTWPNYFQDLWTGRKTFELRRDDRGFAVGHYLRLHEWDPVDGTFTGRTVLADVTSVLRDAEGWGLRDGFVILSLRVHGYDNPAQATEDQRP